VCARACTYWREIQRRHPEAVSGWPFFDPVSWLQEPVLI